ncbi:endolytic transglycosylase MltG [Iodobacter sp. CM08]|uniref:endolytic transglycosylase MltG n=1 Tax=Iodobacter sp. CM08 TaxID=3085902 RepID=UPI002981ADEA|nr:endolytic transglycosylase MltG [Iodobacter sp. CM08]MDW5417475.1 endolytic transglycosylase MltG [Iodobacter sp. CM08]
MAVKKKPQGGFARLLGRLMLLLIGLACAIGVWIYQYASTPLVYKTPQDFVIESGGVKKVADQLVRQGVIDQPILFLLLARISGKDKQLKAGSYNLSTVLSPWQLLEKLSNGDTTTLTFTLIEGANWRDLRKSLNNNPHLRHDTALLSDAELLAELGVSAISPEGLFFPDTYHVDKGSSDLKLLARSHQRMQAKLDKAWAERSANVQLKTPYEALILASLVEKETGRASDRPLVAGVFVNRLRIGMRLQTDPAVIYGVGESLDGRLRKVDLLTDTPYNTYTRSGLPPTPIAMVGDAALKAALNPAPTTALYFVAKGDGSSVFSNTLDEHNSAVRKYILSK